MNLYDFFSLLSLLGYILVTVTAVAALLGSNSRFRRLAFLLALCSFGLHSLLIVLCVVSDPVSLSRGFYLMPLAWVLVGTALLLRWKLRIATLLMFAAPPAFLLLFASLIFHGAGRPLPEALTGPIFFIHILGVFTGIGLMAASAGAGTLFLWQEKNIRNKTPLAGFRKDLPALMSLDRINALATLIGFPAYSLGMVCGFIWARMNWGRSLSGDPKEIFSLLIWLLYAYLFNKRQAHGWRGRKPALLAMGLFLASLLSLFFVNTLLSTHHSFDARF